MEDYYVPINVVLIIIILIVTLVFAYVSVGSSSTFSVPTFSIVSVGHFIISLLFSWIIYNNADGEYPIAAAVIVALCMCSSLGGWMYAYFSGVRGVTQANPVTPSPTIAPATTTASTTV